jgi:hypothetical protein
MVYALSLSVIHKEGLCPSSGGINRLMMRILTVHQNTYLIYDVSIIFYEFVMCLNTGTYLKSIATVQNKDRHLK